MIELKTLKKFASISFSVNNAMIVRRRSGYPFKIYPFGERGHYIDMAMYAEVSTWLKTLSAIKALKSKVLAASEPGGLPWAYLAASSLNCEGVIPIRLSRDEALMPIMNGYSFKRMSCDVLAHNKNIVLFDDVLSTGKTLEQNITLLRKNGFIVNHAIVICSRNPDKCEQLERNMKVSIHCLINDTTVEE